MCSSCTGVCRRYLPHLWEVPPYILNPIKDLSTHLEGDWWPHTKILAKVIYVNFMNQNLPKKLMIFFFFDRNLWFFFFVEKKVKTLYYGKLSRKTSSKSGGKSSNHTSISADETARWARAWAKKNTIYILISWIGAKVSIVSKLNSSLLLSFIFIVSSLLKFYQNKSQLTLQMIFLKFLVLGAWKSFKIKV